MAKLLNVAFSLDVEFLNKLLLGDRDEIMDQHISNILQDNWVVSKDVVLVHTDDSQFLPIQVLLDDQALVCLLDLFTVKIIHKCCLHAYII